MKKLPAHILPVIVFAQFAGTSLWFAGNVVAFDLQQILQLQSDAVGDITSAVQLGFISGTLIFAILSVADRFSPSRVFLFSAVAAAIFNVSVYWFGDSFYKVLVLRFLTGFFLAGIYPVGMKIAADWYATGLGRALGFLVGALVLGTAFPHVLNAFSSNFHWGGILMATSALSVCGGLLLFLTVGDGPNRKVAPKFTWNAIPKIFAFAEFRSAAVGYFGHMWELYAMWTFVPVMLATYNRMHDATIPVALWSFIIIATGFFSCVIGGYISLKKGSAAVALGMLLVSGIFCLISPLLFFLPTSLFLVSLMVWGFAVIGDSPQFSTLVAQTAPKMYIGTALTIVNCIGFALTIFSIQLLVFMAGQLEGQWIYLLLLPGPVIGVISIRRLWLGDGKVKEAP